MSKLLRKAYGLSAVVAMLPVTIASLLGGVYAGGAEAGVCPNAGMGTPGLRVGGELNEVNGSGRDLFGKESSVDLIVDVLDNTPEFLRSLCLNKLNNGMLFG